MRIMDASSDGWGWSRFFGAMLSFLRAVERQENVASEVFCEYAVDRLDLCIRNVSTVILHLQTPNTGQPVSETAVYYLFELLGCL